MGACRNYDPWNCSEDEYGTRVHPSKCRVCGLYAHHHGEFRRLPEAHDCNFHDSVKACINDRCPLHRAMRVWSANLASAGALCKAFRLGVSVDRVTVMCWCEACVYREWRPGCGRSAP